MLPSVADVDVARLSEDARWTLENIAWPMANDGKRTDELSVKHQLPPREIRRLLDELGVELKGIAGIQDLPAMSSEEFDALKASIAEYGQLVPILVDEHYKVVDGHHRERACQELGIVPDVRMVAGDADQLRALALVVNVARRHLTAGARRGIVAGELRRDPTRSDRSIAQAVGVSHTHVAAVRKELEERELVATVATRRGRDGIVQPARKATAKAPPPFAGEKTVAGRYRVVIHAPNGAVVFEEQMLPDDLLTSDWLDDLVELL